ncbi:MAG: AEC family transporter [Psychromonas sp.]
MEQVKLIGIILLGFVVASSLSFVTAEKVDHIRKFTFAFLAPILFLGSIYKANLDNIPSLGLVAAYLGALCLMFLFVKYLCRNDENHNQGNIKALSALYPNALGVGTAIIFPLYGSQAELILMGIIFINITLILPAFNVLMIGLGNSSNFSYKKIITDPIILAIVAGIIINKTGLIIPAPIFLSIEIIGAIAVPSFLAVLGATLSFYSFNDLRKENINLLLLVKLILFPLTTFALGKYCFGLSPLEIKVTVIIASLPTGLNVFILSERYQSAQKTTASVIVLSTVLSLVTIQGWDSIIEFLN